MKNILLSILILSSGRDSLVKCLDSLSHLRAAIPCELIITDTGAPETFRPIHEKYADKLVYFDWCDDFAAARNSGLEKAAGDWCMLIDDDESFLDTADIESFFVNGTYKGYVGAFFNVRSVKDEAHTVYDDVPVFRLFKMQKGVRFIGKIHEYPLKLPGEICRLDTVALHTGYLFKDDREKAAHGARNVRLLEAMLAEEPDNPRWHLHLMLEYRTTGDYRSLKALCEKALSVIDSHLESGVAAGRSKGADYERFTAEDLLCQRGCFYAGLIVSLNRLGEYAEAAKAFDYVMSLKGNTETAVAALHIHRGETEYLRGDYEACVEFTEKGFALLEKLKGKHSDDSFIATDGFPFVGEYLKGARLDDIYQRLIESLANTGREAEAREYIHLVERKTPGHYAALFSAIDSAEELGLYMERLEYEDWTAMVDMYIANKTPEQVSEKADLVLSLAEHYPAACGYYAASLGERFLFTGQEVSLPELYERLKLFANNTLAFYGRFYRDEAFTEDMSLLPRRARVAFYIFKALEATENGDPKTMADILRAGIGVYQRMDAVIEQFLRLYSLANMKSVLADGADLKELVAKRLGVESGSVGNISVNGSGPKSNDTPLQKSAGVETGPAGKDLSYDRELSDRLKALTEKLKSYK